MVKKKLIKTSQLASPSVNPMVAPMVSPSVAPTTYPAPIAPPQTVGYGGIQEEQVDTKPINTLGELLFDADVTEIIENNTSDPTEIAEAIWVQYGGLPNGRVDERKTGAVIHKKSSQRAIDQEKKKTENKKWKRLPKGKNIGDITSLEQLNKIMPGFILSTIKKTTQQEGAAGGGMGGMPPMLASKIKNMVRLANVLDLKGQYIISDKLDQKLSKL